MTYYPIGGVLNGAIFFNVSYDTVTGVLDRAVIFDMTNYPVTVVLNGAIILKVPDYPVGGILDGPVSSDMSDNLVRGILDGSVGFYVPDSFVTGVSDLLTGSLENHACQSHQQTGHLPGKSLHIAKINIYNGTESRVVARNSLIINELTGRHPICVNSSLKCN